MRQEMKLQLSDGRVVGGVDSWSVLLRSVWWLWPVGVALSLPGVSHIARLAYRWVARNRYCLGGQCQVPARTAHQRTIPFLDLP
jgi:predicted DCC family thiol-disulfide oxidoreductase YuxK